MMKKLLWILCLCCCCSLCLAACDKTNNGNGSDSISESVESSESGTATGTVTGGQDQFQLPVTWNYSVYVENSQEHINVTLHLSNETQTALVDMLNGLDEWDCAVYECDWDNEITVGGMKLRYHSACGSLSDITNLCSVVLSEEDQAWMLNILNTTPYPLPE